jgi:CubicO group peptidase (beta-lactamase class C family)
MQGKLFVLVLAVATFCSPQPLPATRQDDVDAAETRVDAAVQQFMELTGATAAAVAVGRAGEIVYQKGYGFSDRRQQVPTRDDVTMRLASCTKPITRALIELLIVEGKIERDTRIFEYLGISPPDDRLADERVREITVAHLLEHTGGWDRDATFDPEYHTDEIARELRVPRLEKRHIARYMWSQPLQADPGTTVHYSNFGYLLLGLVIEKATGMSYIEAVRERIGEPLGIDDFSLSSANPSARSEREVWYRNENRMDLRLRDSSSGLVTSAPSLCRFLGAWWMDGVPRNDYRDVFFFHFGTHPLTTTTIMEQRLDGLDYVLMFNARREDSFDADNESIRDQFNRVLDEAGSALGSSDQ